MREWITTDCRNTPSITNPEDEEIVDAPGNDGNTLMLEQVKRPNPWKKMMIYIYIYIKRKADAVNSYQITPKVLFLH